MNYQNKIRFSRLFYDLYVARDKQGPEGDPNTNVLELLNIALIFQNCRPFGEMDDDIKRELKDKGFYNRDKAVAHIAFEICYTVSKKVKQRRKAEEQELAQVNNQTAVDDRGNQYGWYKGAWKVVHPLL